MNGQTGHHNLLSEVKKLHFYFFCRHYWAFKVEPYSYMVKVGVASDTKLIEWFHNPRDTSSPRYVQPYPPPYVSIIYRHVVYR